MIYRCCDENRRMKVRGRADVNGIDYLEVLDREAPLGSPRQRTLLVRFVNDAPTLTLDQLVITGGERVGNIGIDWVMHAHAPGPKATASEKALFTALPDPKQVLVLRTSSSGDYSTYTLHIVSGPKALAPPAGIDALLARVGFSFKVECPSDTDCLADPFCPVETAELPAISYLAKDYSSFRRLMLDRMAQTLPEWSERNAADLGIALVETLAYVGDRLSYAQDAVATEAYIGTARRRSSVRRHARLVAYRMHDGANARAWIQVLLDPAAGRVDLPPEGVQFLTRVEGFAPVIPPEAPPTPERAYQKIMMTAPTVFEPIARVRQDPSILIDPPIPLFAAHERIEFHDWGDGECCIPAGSVRATLRGNLADLRSGDIMILEEVLGPRTGDPADADPAKRHAVRLVQVATGLTDMVMNVPITEIRWADEDALPFSLCLSARTADGGSVTEVSVARGNILLADHGRTLGGIELGTVPEPHLWEVVDECCAQCDPAAPRAIPPRFRPRLSDAPVTQAQRLVPDPVAGLLSAAAQARLLPADAVPVIGLREHGSVPARVWEARPDLLASSADDRHFAVEVESDGSARLRFGDDRNGRRPDSGTRFVATYRVGGGAAGNVGGEALAHIVTATAGIVGVRNPMAARGGTEPESVEAARIAAPQAFRVQQRAVTPADYAEVARRHPSVQRAVATFRWNGHGHTVFVTVDRFGEAAVSPEFRAELAAFLEPYRMAGYDLEIDAPRFVAVDLALMVCVSPDHFRSQVRLAVLAELSDRRLADGRFGFFHPDNLSFAEPVYLSAIIARVQSVEGVESVNPTVFGRLGVPDAGPLETGVLRTGRLEIARLPGDPDYPERGRLKLTMGGGR